MKRNLLVTILLLNSLASLAQLRVNTDSVPTVGDEKEILKKSYEKCQSVKNGYYEMTEYRKTMSRKDTAVSSFNCSFKKVADDTLLSSLFHFQSYFKGKYTGEVMYTGSELIWYTAKDSSGTIMSKSKWPDEIRSYSRNYTFFSPLTNYKSYPMPHDSDLIDKKHTFKLLGEENIYGNVCYHIRVNERLKNDPRTSMKCVRSEFHYWIRKADYIPLQYSIAFDLVMKNDTMFQFEKFVLNKYEINTAVDESQFSINSVPSYYHLKDFVPHKKPDPLTKDTIAPNWELLSLTDEKVSLKDFKGKLVLVDFFYKACYPCMVALPALEALNQKYKDRGLKIIGIDPYDKKEDDIADFLRKRGVTYTVLLGGKETSKDYHVSTYPSTYLIDKTGKIIFTYEGYNKDFRKTLEEIIDKNL